MGWYSTNYVFCYLSSKGKRLIHEIEEKLDFLKSCRDDNGDSLESILEGKINLLMKYGSEFKYSSYGQELPKFCFDTWCGLGNIRSFLNDNIMIIGTTLKYANFENYIGLFSFLIEYIESDLGDNIFEKNMMFCDSYKYDPFYSCDEIKMHQNFLNKCEIIFDSKDNSIYVKNDIIRIIYNDNLNLVNNSLDNRYNIQEIPNEEFKFTICP